MQNVESFPDGVQLPAEWGGILFINGHLLNGLPTASYSFFSILLIAIIFFSEKWKWASL